MVGKIKKGGKSLSAGRCNDDSGIMTALFLQNTLQFFAGVEPSLIAAQLRPGKRSGYYPSRGTMSIQQV
jgi:hypothetical protein